MSSDSETAVPFFLRNIRAIKLNEPNFSSYVNPRGEPLMALENIGAINLFVGANNSGKSRVLRSLSKQSKWDVILDGMDLVKMPEDIKQSIKEFVFFLKESEILDLSFFDLEKFVIQTDEWVGITGADKNKFQDIYNSVNSMLRAPKEIAFIRHGIKNRLSDMAPKFQDTLLGKVQNIKGLISNYDNEYSKYSSYGFSKVYIPVTRGLRQIDLDDAHKIGAFKDLYAERVMKDYFDNRKAGDITIFTGLSLFEDLRNLLLGNREERARVKEFEDFLATEILEVRSFTLTPHKNGSIYITINDVEHPIHHLGDGVQSIIILMWLAFTSEKPCCFFIEEPEIYLHPGLQRRVLEQMALRKKHIFFITTHSNHMLDMSSDFGDVRIFQCRSVADSIEKFSIRCVDRTDRSTLALLGAQNSSMFLVNATVWVEGVTDRWYIREFLRIYEEHLKEQKEFIRSIREDRDYAFVEYGGGNIVHWDFSGTTGEEEEDQYGTDSRIDAATLCGEAIVIIDKDDTEITEQTDAQHVRKHQRIKKLQDELQDRLLITPGREIENILPPKVLEATMQELEPKKTKLNIANISLSYDAYKDKKIGRYLHDECRKKNGTKKYAGEYDVLHAKVDFARIARKKLEGIKFKDFTSDAQEFIKKIYNHIEKILINHRVR